LTFDRRTVLALAAAAGTLPAAVPAEAQLAPPRPERTFSGADLAALHGPQPGGLEERTLGPENAPVTLVEYASMTCPHCAAFHNDVVPVLKSRYVDQGRMRLIFRAFPLNPLDSGVAMLARCSPAERFFSVIEVYFQQQRTWLSGNDPVAGILAIARQVGFTQETFETCLRNQGLLDSIQAVRDAGAQRFGINSTPTLFINGQMFRGALSIAQVEAVITPMLRT